jgi:hypothetical protein
LIKTKFKAEWSLQDFAQNDDFWISTKTVRMNNGKKLETTETCALIRESGQFSMPCPCILE